MLKNLHSLKHWTLCSGAGQVRSEYRSEREVTSLLFSMSHLHLLHVIGIVGERKIKAVGGK